MIDHGKKNILGVRISAVDYEAATKHFIDAGKAEQKFTMTALAVHGVMTGALEPVHRYRLNRLDMIVPDGMPVKWGLNWIHQANLPDRVYGPTLMLKCCEAAAEVGLPIFLFGTTSDTLENLSARLKEKYPKLLVAGTEASRFRRISEVDAKGLVDRIRNSGAKVLFVGLGCPRQEVFAYELGEALQMPVFAVGAAFQFHAGLLAQAPSWMQAAGLEWLFRFINEPRRLWWRYVYYNPYYLWLLMCQRLKFKTLDPEDSLAPTERILYG